VKCRLILINEEKADLKSGYIIYTYPLSAPLDGMKIASRKAKGASGGEESDGVQGACKGLRPFYNIPGGTVLPLS
jgi:hypothetical protein